MGGEPDTSEEIILSDQEVNVAAKVKVCSKCGIEKPLASFHVDRSAADHRKCSCRECYNKIKGDWRLRNQEKIRGQRKESYARCRESYLAYNRSDNRRANHFRWKLRRQFGISTERYDQMLSDQGGCCAICRRPPSEAHGHKHKHRLHIDHDHKTGLVRGLLCNNCNAGLGYFADSAEHLEGAIDYLFASISEEI